MYNDRTRDGFITDSEKVSRAIADGESNSSSPDPRRGWPAGVLDAVALMTSCRGV
jgi:hypothetical protein